MLDSPGSNEALQQTRELKRPSKRDRLDLSKRHAPHPISEMRLERARPAADICLLRRPQLSGAAPSTASWPAPGAGTHLFLVKGILKRRGGHGFFSPVVHYIF